MVALKNNKVGLLQKQQIRSLISAEAFIKALKIYYGHFVLGGSNRFTCSPFNIHLTSTLLLDMIQLEYIYARH